MSSRATRTYYDARYATEGGQAFPADPGRYHAWFDSLLDLAPDGARMLDYGCGVGYACSMFADLGYEVTGIDIADAAVRIAAEREPRGSFLLASAGPLPFDDATFDVVTCLGVLEHIPDPAPVVAELRRVARAGATAVWVLPNARSPFFWFGHGTEQEEETPRTLEAWRRLLAAGGWRVTGVRRDPGPLDRPVSRWKRAGQALLNRLPLQLTYQFVIESRPDAPGGQDAY